MPPVVNPVSDLARIYRQRVPTQTGQARFGPEAVARIQPNMNRGAGPLGAMGRLARTAVESLDPRLILSEGGRSVQHAVGDATELAKSVISGRDTLSQSPTARTYQAAGGGAQGAFAAAMPYVNAATAVYPFAKAMTPAGALAIERAASEAASSQALTEGIANARALPRPSAPIQPNAALAEQMANRLLPERPTIWMKPPGKFAKVVFQNDDIQIVDPYGYRPDRPIIHMKPDAVAEAVVRNAADKPQVDFQMDVLPGGPKPEWMRFGEIVRNGDLNPAGDLSPEELAKLREMDMPNQVRARFEKADFGTRQLPNPNPIEENLDYVVNRPENDIDLTRIFADEKQAAVIGGLPEKKYKAQVEFRKAAIKWVRDNKILNNSKYPILPETWVNMYNINDLVIWDQDLEDIYVDIMWRYGL